MPHMPSFLIWLSPVVPVTPTAPGGNSCLWSQEGCGSSSMVVFLPTERGPCPWCMWRICRSAGSCGDSGGQGRGRLPAQCHPALRARLGSWRWAPTGTQLPRVHLSVSPKAPCLPRPPPPPPAPPHVLRCKACRLCCQTPRCVWILALPLTNKLFDEPCCSSSKYKVPVGLTLDPDPFSWAWDSGLASRVLQSTEWLADGPVFEARVLQELP